MYILYNILTFMMNTAYTWAMEKKSAQLYSKTFDTINRHRGEKNIATFIDDAVNHYVMARSDKSEMTKIRESLDSIRETQRTILGLNCEMLRQAGILNGNGEMDVLKRNRDDSQR